MQRKPADPHHDMALVSTFLLQALGQVVAQKGGSAEHLCRGLGFSLADLDDPAQRVSYRQAVAMIQRALKVLPDQGLGLWVGYQNVLGTLGLLGHVVSLCKTLRDAFAIGERHQHTSGAIASSHTYECGQEVFVDVECLLPDAEVQVFVSEEFLASLMVYGRALLGQDFAPLRVEFRHTAPLYIDEYLHIFGADVRFGGLHNRMVLARHWMDVRLPNHHALALRQALDLLEQESTQLHEKMDLIQAVERAIFRDLQRSQLAKVASDLNMSGRTLRRRLIEHGLTFEGLREQVRRARTMSLLGNPSLTLERITEEVGYSDVRSFRRAFKRWAGLSPSAFRGEGRGLA